MAGQEFRKSTSSAGPADSRMVRPSPFCGKCGNRFPSEEDHYCRTCGQSANLAETNPHTSGFQWNWRFLLVIPAFLIGIILPGMLVRISAELVIPGGDSLFLPFAEVSQSMADGAFAVFLPRLAAPHSKKKISLGAGILLIAILGSILAYSFATDYYAGVGAGTVLWQVVLFLITGLAAGVAMLYSQIK